MHLYAPRHDQNKTGDEGGWVSTFRSRSIASSYVEPKSRAPSSPPNLMSLAYKPDTQISSFGLPPLQHRETVSSVVSGALADANTPTKNTMKSDVAPSHSVASSTCMEPNVTRTPSLAPSLMSPAYKPGANTTITQISAFGLPPLATSTTTASSPKTETTKSDIDMQDNDGRFWIEVDLSPSPTASPDSTSCSPIISNSKEAPPSTSSSSMNFGYYGASHSPTTSVSSATSAASTSCNMQNLINRTSGLRSQTPTANHVTNFALSNVDPSHRSPFELPLLAQRPRTTPYLAGSHRHFNSGRTIGGTLPRRGPDWLQQLLGEKSTSRLVSEWYFLYMCTDVHSYKRSAYSSAISR